MGERIGVDITNMIYDTAASVVADAREVMDYQGLQMDVMQVFAMEVPFTEEEFRAGKENVLADKLAEEAMETFKRRMDTLQKVAYPVIKNVYEERGAMYENILVPITDGKRAYNVAVNLKAAYETECREVVREFEKRMLLFVIDDEWKEHLRQLDELKQSVQNASYEQKDPLLIYKLESYELFAKMLDKINKDTLSILNKAYIPTRENNPESVQQERQQKAKVDVNKLQASRMAAAAAAGQADKAVRLILGEEADNDVLEG